MAPLCSRTGLAGLVPREGDDFLGRIVTMDETWARSYEPNLKPQSSEWKHSGSPRPKKVRPTQCAVKVMLIVAYDTRCISKADYKRLPTTACSCSTTFARSSGENDDTW